MSPPRRPTNPSMPAMGPLPFAENEVSQPGLQLESVVREAGFREGPKDPVWFKLLERFGFPTLVAAGLAWGFVGYNRQVREDAGAMRREFRETVDVLAKDAAQDRRETAKALGDVLSELRQIREQLRDRGASGGRGR